MSWYRYQRLPLSPPSFGSDCTFLSPFEHSPCPHSNRAMGAFTSVQYLPTLVLSMPLVHNKKPHGKGISGVLNVDIEANENSPGETPARTESWEGTIIQWERKRAVLSICS